MAARTGAGVGVGVTITLLGVLSLTLFVLTIVFLSKYQASQKNLNAALSDTEQFIKASERGLDEIQRLKEQARGASVVGYLNDSLKTAMTRVTGNPRDTVEQLASKLQAIPGAESQSLLAVIRERDTQIADLRSKLAAADTDRQTALADLQNEVDRVKALEESHQRTLATLTEDLERYKAEVDGYREGTNQVRMEMDAAIEKARRDAEDERVRLNNQIAKLREDNLILMSQVQTLRREKGKDILKPASEESLVDGTIAGVNPSEESVFLSLGRGDKIRVGMKFAVYSEPTAIRVDETTGEYARPKGQVEVVNVGERSSTARVLWETKGNPIVRGDVIANPVYDPNKTYTFLVYGNFDANGDGRATPAEQADIVAMVQAWGGKVTDELTGNVDFLVLGQRPILPPAPTADTPIAIVREYMRLNSIVERYNSLLEQAQATSLPVLNENRLYTLIGERGSGLGR